MPALSRRSERSLHDAGAHPSPNTRAKSADTPRPSRYSRAFFPRSSSISIERKCSAARSVTCLSCCRSRKAGSCADSSSTPASRARSLTVSTKLFPRHRWRKAMASPPTWQPKQWNRCRSGVTWKEAVFSSWKGHLPLKLRPDFFSSTYRETTATMSARSRTSSILCSGIRKGAGRTFRPKPLLHLPAGRARGAKTSAQLRQLGLHLVRNRFSLSLSLDFRNQDLHHRPHVLRRFRPRGEKRALLLLLVRQLGSVARPELLHRVPSLLDQRRHHLAHAGVIQSHAAGLDFPVFDRAF